MIVGYHSIIKYTPDLFRNESMNVGAVVAFPSASYIAMRMEPNAERLRALDPDVDMTRFDTYVKYHQHRFEQGPLRVFNEGEGDLFKYVEPWTEDYLRELARWHATSQVRFSFIGSVEIQTDSITHEECEQYLNRLVDMYVSFPPKDQS